jgi:hypothetical protein
MCEAWGRQKGFALDKIVFLKHGKQQAIGTAVPGDLCTCYADGYDIRQLTNDGKMSISRDGRTRTRSTSSATGPARRRSGR